MWEKRSLTLSHQSTNRSTRQSLVTLDVTRRERVHRRRVGRSPPLSPWLLGESRGRLPWWERGSCHHEQKGRP